ncbi:MAG: hypothetical protein B7Z75_14175 [Acidocella sp. 20-57-95]|nr:MAG: hypothetical protein B7Z75_14175 [Acidocella sp. 20-57-95]OYV57907.1 MAG: hypothetical protein B7Z71_11665 [Acidocella sp. 21-58-7]HQT64024.1 CopD family protein [Acidocella sp.]HQU04247.1 CopD family protein [Acidocella sp.]
MTVPALQPFYFLLLAGHVSAVILWMSGMIILPAIYAQHGAISPNVAILSGLADLERKIIKRLVNPAMYAAWGFGVLLIVTPGAISWHDWWWRIKFFAVLLLSGYHGLLSIWRRQLASGTSHHTVKFYNSMVFAPVAFVVLIVTLVILKP